MTVIALLLTVGLEAGPEALAAMLDHPDVEVRDQAASDLLALGRAALPALHGRPGTEHVTLQILEEIAWTRKARLLRGWRCRAQLDPCPLVFSEPDPALANLFPGARIIVARGAGIHCYRHCWGEWVLGISGRDGSMFTIRSPGFGTGVRTLGDLPGLGRKMKPVGSKNEAIVAASAITGISPDLGFVAWEVGDRIVVRAPRGLEARLFEFDSEGRLCARRESKRPPG